MVEHMFIDMECLVGSHLKIPVLTNEEKHRYLGIPLTSPLFQGQRDKPYDWAVPYFATRTELMFQYINDVRIFHSWVNRSLATFTKYRSWEELVANMSTDVNGQVKNFLVAVRTAMSHTGDSIRILIRGSKSSSGSGVWQWMFADFLAARYKDVVIDCYDPCETDTVEVRDYLVDGVAQTATITKYALCYLGDGEGYDVAIDDAYDTDVLRWDPKASIYSLKDLTMGCVPYLHPLEGRKFSHDVNFNICSPCPCLTCRTIASFSCDYQTFQTIKAFTVLLGGLPCLNAEFSRELRAKAKIYKQIVVKPLVQIAKPTELRASLMLSSSLNMASATNAVSLVNSSNSDRTLPFSRIKGLASSISQSVCDRLVDKNVVFIGVDPAVLGSTRLKLTGTPTYFVNTSDQVFIRNFAPDTMWVTDSTVQGYCRTGYEWEYFYEYHKVIVQHDSYETHFSVVSGVPISSNDLSWTKDVPGTYRLPIDTKIEGRFLGWHPDNPYDLVKPFSVDSKGRDSFLSLDNLSSVVHLDPQKVKFASVWCEAGTHHIREMTRECRFTCDNGVYSATSNCLHDHIHIVNGKMSQYMESERLVTVHVTENAYAHILRLPRSQSSHESISVHYERHRSGLKVHSGYDADNPKVSFYVVYRVLK
jgi:hypothetical protein